MFFFVLNMVQQLICGKVKVFQYLVNSVWNVHFYAYDYLFFTFYFLFSKFGSKISLMSNSDDSSCFDYHLFYSMVILYADMTNWFETKSLISKICFAGTYAPERFYYGLHYFLQHLLYLLTSAEVQVKFFYKLNPNLECIQS